MARKKRDAKRKRRRNGSARRKPVGRPAKVHNAARGKWLKVCGEVTRMGGQLVEIPATSP